MLKTNKFNSKIHCNNYGIKFDNNKNYDKNNNDNSKRRSRETLSKSKNLAKFKKNNTKKVKPSFLTFVTKKSFN